MLPEDYHMWRQSLVRLWVAEGFAVREGENSPEDVAELYLSELIQRNMLEVVKYDELGRVLTCKMHDIVRNLALSVAKDERFGSANNSATILLMDKEVRRLSICGWKDKSASKARFPHLRTLISCAAISSCFDMLTAILPESKYLTVLELEGSQITEVRESIGDLFNLRYIGLRRTKVKSPPKSIGKLSNLSTLDMYSTEIEKLPPGIGKIKKLRHLFAESYVNGNQSEFRCFIGVQPPEELCHLEELQTLVTVQESKDLAEQLKKLTQLRSLWIENISAANCANLCTTLSNMQFLSSLLLSASDKNEELCLECLKPSSTRLHKLIIRGLWANGTLQVPIFKDYGRNLKYLALNWCHLGEDPLQLLANNVPNLTYLKLNTMNSAEKMVLSAKCFLNLKELFLRCMLDVKRLDIEDGALPCIERLYIKSLSKLHEVPKGLDSLRSLKVLSLKGLHSDFKKDWNNKGMNNLMRFVQELHI